MNVEELIDNEDIKKIARKYYRYLDIYDREALEQEFFLYCFERINDIEIEDVIKLCKECYSYLRKKQAQYVITIDYEDDCLQKINKEQTDIYIITDNREQLYQKEYYSRNKDRINKRSLEWHYNNREKHIAMNKEYHKAHKEEEKIKAKERYLKNKEQRKEYQRRYYQEHKEEILRKKRERKNDY